MLRPSRQTTQSLHLAAPTGGLNAISGASATPPTDCAAAVNLIPSERGLRVRTGYQEWCTNVTGALDNTVRTILPFTGSAASGAGDKLFAVTSTGIWDVTSSGSSPTSLIEFPSSTGDAGYGVGAVCTTLAGRFMLYADEVNGLYVYGEAAGTWSPVIGATTQLWGGEEGYEVGNLVVNGGNEYVCVTAGLSDSTGSGPTGTGSGIEDGTVVWDYVAAAANNVIGPSLADQNAGFTADPSRIVFVAVWGSRVWLVERDTSRAYYLDVNSIYGTATSFDFGSKMQKGGPLVGLWSWSYDGGSGLDALLVAISTAGDVVIYRGSDPTDALTFGLKGSWFAGGVPKGRRIATDTGGDLFVASVLGLLPLSRLVVGGEELNQGEYATSKIAPVFSRLTSLYAGNKGWGIYVHPTDNVLLVTVPVAEGEASEQLAMSLTTKGWFPYADLPIVSAAVWSRELYFGTSDGRVCRNVGGVDDVKLDDSTDFDPIDWSLLTAFQNLGNGANKQIVMVRPVLLSETPDANVRAEARYDYAQTELADSAEVGGGGDGTWDGSAWDSSTWAPDYQAKQAVVGATGMGRAVAVALRGNAISRTTLVGVDIFLRAGGML